MLEYLRILSVRNKEEKKNTDGPIGVYDVKMIFQTLFFH